MVTILSALRQIREDLSELLERTAVERICRELEYTWRERQLDPYTTLHLFILQIVNQNTAMTHLPHLSGERFSASAYCQARQRLPLELIERLVDSFSRGLETSEPASLWHGHRVMLVDGSGFSMPDTPELQAYFGQPGQQKPGCGFPVAHMLAMMDAHNGFLHDVMISPLRTHDMKHAAELHPRLSPDDIVVADRGFCSYAHLALLSQAKLHAVFRIHQKQIVNFQPHRLCKQDVRKGSTGLPTSRWVKRLGHCDQLVKWQKPKSPPKWIKREDFDRLPDELMVRELKKEALMCVLVHNLVRAVVLKAARRQRVSPRRISFIDALRWLQPPKPHAPLPELVINPVRPGRVEPRCIKRRPKEYDRMKRPRDELRKRLKNHRDAA